MPAYGSSASLMRHETWDFAAMDDETERGCKRAPLFDNSVPLKELRKESEIFEKQLEAMQPAERSL